MNRFLFRCTVAGALGGLLFGFDTAVISGTTQALTEHYQLTAESLGFTVSIALWGTVIGALIIGLLNNGLTILGLSSFWQYVAKGTVIVLAVMLDKWRYQQQAN